MVQNALRTDSLWAIVQFYAFARTQVFNKSNFSCPWSIFLSTKVWIFYMVCGHLDFFFNILVGSQFTWKRWLQTYNFCYSWIFHSHQFYSSRVVCTEARTDIFFQFSQLHWETQNLKIIVMIQILQLFPLIGSEFDAGLVWITFSSPSSGCLRVHRPLLHTAAQMVSLVAKAKSLAQSNPLWEMKHSQKHGYLHDYDWGKRIYRAQNWCRIVTESVDMLGKKKKPDQIATYCLGRLKWF